MGPTVACAAREGNEVRRAAALVVGTVAGVPATPALADQLTELGFTRRGRDRLGAVVWVLSFNRHLEFQLHEDADAVVVTWRFDLGEFLLRRGWQIGAAETSFQELYPQADSRVPATAAAVEAELRRVLGQLRIDLGDPSL